MKKYLLALLIVLLACSSVFAAVVASETVEVEIVGDESADSVELIMEALDAYEGDEDIEDMIDEITALIEALPEETLEAVVEKVLSDAEENGWDEEEMIEAFFNALLNEYVTSEDAVIETVEVVEVEEVPVEAEVEEIVEVVEVPAEN